MTARWLVVLAAAVALVATPVVVGLRPVAEVNVEPAALAAQVQASGSIGWSGSVQSEGTLQLPQSDSFATLGQLLGEDLDLRVWWSGPREWRVDRIRSTGETNLFRQGRGQVRWIFESQRATYSPVSEIRLPDAPDVLPPTLGRTMLQGVQPEELSPLPERRVAGVDAAGLRLTPADPAGTVARVDLWADPASGLPLRVEVYGEGSERAVLTTTVTDLTLGAPDPDTIRFSPPDGVAVAYEESVDVAAAANALTFVDLPRRLGGLEARDGEDPGAVGVYGRGPTRMIVVPLRGAVSRPLRERLTEGGATSTALGTLAPTGPVGVLLTPRRERGGAFLLTGTVDADTLQRAADELGDAR